MNPSTSSSALEVRLSKYSGVITAVAGFVFALIWLLLPELKDAASSSVKFNTAFLFLVLGLALVFHWRDENWSKRSTWVRLAAVFVFLIGAAELVEIIFNINFGLDEVVVTDFITSESQLHPGQMSPLTAICFMFSSVALFVTTMKNRAKWLPNWVSVLPVCLICLFALVGYIYHVRSLYQFGHFLRISWQTAAIFVIYSTGLIFSQPSAGPAPLFLSQSAGGTAARSLIPVSIFAPIILGYIRILGQHLGAFDLETGTALRTLASIITFTIVIWLTAKKLDVLDAEKERSQNLLRLSERKFAKMFDLSPAAVILVKWPMGEVVDVNPAWVNLFGFTREDAIGKTSQELGWYRNLIERETLYQKLESEGRLRNYESNILTKSGEPRVISWNLEFMTINDEKHVIGTIDDVTETKAALESLVESEANYRQLASDLQVALRTRDDFMSIASHELKTPLTTLRLQLNLRQRLFNSKGSDAFDAKRLKEIFQIDSRQLDRLNRLIDDMLDISRIRTGRLALNRSTTNVTKIIEDVVQQLGEQIISAGNKLTLDLDGQIEAFVDRDRFEQVIVNLITNALKYAPGSDVKITAKRNNQMAEVRVSDNGPGIAAEDRNRIFDRFERAVSKNDVSGLGLGLYIVREIIELHQGKIHLESEIGRGATFVVSVPQYPLRA